MKICENCQKENDGSYGSSRFCNEKCARGFSTKEKRSEINKKVSKKLKGRIGNNKNGFRKGYDPRRKIFSYEDRLKGWELSKKYTENKILSTPIEKLSKGTRKKLLIKERGNRCETCKNTHWLGNSIKLELEHKDGNKNNNIRDNLLLLCPNCHSFTLTWRKSKNPKKKNQVTDSMIREALKNNNSIRSVLKSLGLSESGAGNYLRIKRIFEKDMVPVTGFEPVN